MKTVALITTSSINKFEDVKNYLKSLSYAVNDKDSKSFFIYKDCSSDEMKRAIKTAKETAKFTSTLNIVYGTSNTSI